MANVEKRGSSYRITVSCGYDTHGRQIKKNMTWKPAPNMTEKQIKKELERQKVLFEEKVANGLFLDGNIRFDNYIDKWLEDYAKPNLKATTFNRYQYIAQNIKTELGHLRLCKIQPHHLIEYYNKLSQPDARKDGKCVPLPVLMDILKEKKGTFPGIDKEVVRSCKNGKAISRQNAEKVCSALHRKFNSCFSIPNSTLSNSTIQYYHKLIKKMLNTAIEWQCLLLNPADRVKPPKIERKEAAYLDEKGAAALLVSLEKEPIQYKTMVYVLLFTGVRRGELLGLEWKDIDFDHAVMTIQRNALYTNDKGLFTDTPKTDKSIRTIKMPQNLINLLKEYRTYQNEERLKLGSLWKDTDRLFTQWDGSPIHPSTLTKWFHNFAEKEGLSGIHVHSLRHTNATLMIASGVDLPTVAKRLGHAQQSTTSNIYAHAIQSADERAAEMLNDILNPSNKKLS